MKGRIVSHYKVFVVMPPAHPRRAVASGSLDALLSLLWQCLAVHGFLLLISWAVFLAASPGVRFLIVAGWVSYVVAAAAFVASSIRDARTSRSLQRHN